MKKLISVLFTLLLAVVCSTESQAGPVMCDNTRIAQKPNAFSRTFRFETRQISKTNQTNSDLEITRADFAKHMEVGNERIFISAEDPNGMIAMNVGSVDINGTNAQTWILPDFSGYNTDSMRFEHVTVASTGFEGYYPEVTHAVKYLDAGRFIEANGYELYALDDVELFSYGYTAVDAETSETYMEDLYLAMSPVPLKIGEAYTGYVLFEYSEDPNYDSTLFQQDYDVVGYGTLNLPNGKSVEAIKLIFTEYETDYKDGEIIDEYYYEEIVWYSKEGYYVRVGIDDAWTQEGDAEVYYIDYQEITKTNAVTSLEDFTQHKLNLFPNPVAKGQSLNFQTDANFRPDLVELFDVQGKKVGSMPLSGNSNNQFEVGIPQSLTSGVYFYLAYDQKENGLARGKIIIE